MFRRLAQIPPSLAVLCVSALAAAAPVTLHVDPLSVALTTYALSTGGTNNITATPTAQADHLTTYTITYQHIAGGSFDTPII